MGTGEGLRGWGLQAGQDSAVQHDGQRRHAALPPQHRVGVADRAPAPAAGAAAQRPAQDPGPGGLRGGGSKILGLGLRGLGSGIQGDPTVEQSDHALQVMLLGAGACCEPAAIEAKRVAPVLLAARSAEHAVGEAVFWQPPLQAVAAKGRRSDYWTGRCAPADSRRGARCTWRAWTTRCRWR